MKKALNVIFGKLAFHWNQPTTKAGLVGFIGLFGFAIKPEWVEGISLLIGGAISLIFVFTSERPDRTIKEVPEEKK